MGQHPRHPTTDRTGVILAAGFGSRLQGVSSTTFLKPLTSVGGEPLLVRAIRSLEVAGCARVVVVTGFGSGDVETQVRRLHQGPAELIFAENPRYDLKNGVSVLAAAPHVPGEFVLMMADHVVDDDVMILAGSHAPVDEGATLLVDYKLDTIFDMDDATKVLSDGDRIRAIGKQLTDFDCVDTGVFVCTRALMAALERVFAAQGDASLSDGIQALADAGRMRLLDIGGGFWQDVDTPEMLAHAESVLSARQQTARAAGI
ncbi:MAG: NTP transferase domain-containing protein [Deltaproteobacteria bacterium]|nr:NTP transferase domain-containing protein [Deltaproteobacteria bacterium]MCB9788408.1 NTP transferase domain-containing protein [Deltaproteobacteria bacterium]